MLYKFIITSFLFLPACILAQNSAAVDPPSKLTVGKGSLFDRVELKWTAVPEAVSYEIYRSENGSKFDMLASVPEIKYSDTAVKPGNQYFYHIITITQNGRSKPGSKESGYARINAKSKYNLEKIIDSYNKPVPSMSALDKKRHKFLDEHYLGWLKFKFIMWIGKPYVKRGTVSVFTDFENFRIDEDSRSILVTSKDGDYRIIFGTNRFFTILSRSGDREMMEILVRNSVAFCVFQRDIKTTNPDGSVRFIPQFEALGFASTYFRKNKNWSSNTVMFGTSNDELMGRMKNIEKKASK